MKRVFTALLIFLLLAAMAGVIYWMIAVRGYPWWTGLVLVLGALGMLFGVLAIRRTIRRRNEQEFVKRVIAQDEEAIRIAPEADKPHLMELQEKWRESVELLRGSYLRRQGNPLYVLPWYLILGESGSGKTSAVKNTNLNSPLGETRLNAGISVTRNCDWWFFEEAVILDTAGRYTIPIDEGRDREEWEKFLSLLARYRRREPVNGILVTIAADKLLEMNEARLGEEGRSVRKRIDQLMRILGAAIPVYVLVTKIDLIPGMLEFSNLLPAEGRGQAMGYVNTDLSAGWKTVLDEAQAAVARRLRDLQFILVHGGDEPEPEMFLFLHGFDRLKPALDLYIQALFAPNPYQPTPPFRGMFFSSAIQEGRAPAEYTGFFAGEGADEDRTVLHNNGLFLRDLFQNILPRDRSLFRPIPEFLRPRKSLSLAILSWALIWAALGGVAAFSALTSRNALRAAAPVMTNPPKFEGIPSRDLTEIRRLGEAARAVERINRHWPIPILGYRQGFTAEREIKTRYVRDFRDHLLRPFDTALMNALRAVPGDSTGTARLSAFGCLVARIDLLREYRKDEPPPRALGRFREVAGELLTLRDSTLASGAATLFGDAYFEYLTWAGPEVRDQELASLRALLEARLRIREDLQWIALNWTEEPDPVRPGDFWNDPPGEEYDADTVTPGIYTKESRVQIAALFEALKGALNSPEAAEEERNFWRWYETQLYEAWSSFAIAFPRDARAAAALPGERGIIASMTYEQNPYFDFLSFLAGELRDLPPGAEPPSWALLVVKLDDLRKQAEADSARAGTVLEKLENQKDRLFRNTVGKADPSRQSEEKTRKAMVKAWTEYTAALERISESVSSPESCFRAISDLNAGDGNAVSPFMAARDRFRRLQSLLGHEDAPFIWDLVIGPQRFLLEYSAAEAAGVLQSRWDHDVLGGIRDMDRDDIPRALFDQKEGLVWKFVAEAGKPFVTRNQFGWSAVDTGEGLLTVREEFIEFLNNGPKSIVTYEPSYTVTLETLPVEANREATVKPFGCTIVLQCEAERQSLENYNYPRRQSFTWTPEGCGETVLTIFFPDLTLTRTYPGKMGFAEFLADFVGEGKTFTPEDFPRERERLEKMGVSFIRISYRTRGALAVTRLLERNPARVPLVIAGE